MSRMSIKNRTLVWVPQNSVSCFCLLFSNIITFLSIIAEIKISWGHHTEIFWQGRTIFEAAISKSEYLYSKRQVIHPHVQVHARDMNAVKLFPGFTYDSHFYIMLEELQVNVGEVNVI